MKNNFAFTFIELIVSISIMLIIGGSGMFYFHDFIGKQESKILINMFQKNIDSLDYKVKKQNIFDYRLTIKKGAIGYVFSTNNVGLSHSQIPDFNSIHQTGSIHISGYPSSEDIVELEMFQNGKKVKHFIDTADSQIEFDINKNSIISGFISGKPLNILHFEYFSDTENPLFITDIRDITNSSYDSLIVSNINGKKVYSDNHTSIIPPIQIVFEKNGIENILELN